MQPPHSNKFYSALLSLSTSIVIDFMTSWNRSLVSGLRRTLARTIASGEKALRELLEAESISMRPTSQAGNSSAEVAAKLFPFPRTPPFRTDVQVIGKRRLPEFSHFKHSSSIH